MLRPKWIRSCKLVKENLNLKSIFVVEEGMSLKVTTIIEIFLHYMYKWLNISLLKKIILKSVIWECKQTCVTGT